MCGGHISSMKNGSKLVIQTTNLNFVKELFPGTNTQMLTLTASLNLIIFWKMFFLGTTQWCWPDCQCKSGFSERASSWKFTQWCWPDCQCSSTPPPHTTHPNPQCHNSGFSKIVHFHPSVFNITITASTLTDNQSPVWLLIGHILLVDAQLSQVARWWGYHGGGGRAGGATRFHLDDHVAGNRK